MKNGNITENNLQIQLDVHQNPNVFFADRKISPKIHMEAYKTPNSKSNSEQNKQFWRYQNVRLQIILKAIVTKTSLKPDKRPKEQNRRLRNKTTQLQPFDF
jgi:hypothetical protein